MGKDPINTTSLTANAPPVMRTYAVAEASATPATTHVVHIYTDGSCIQGTGDNADQLAPGHGCGGWGAVIIDPAQRLHACIGGGETDTTNTRMEVLAVYSALRHLLAHVYDQISGMEINIWSDSEYVTKGIVALPNWRVHGWVTKKGTQVANSDLWINIDTFVTTNNITLKPHWVKGHSGSLLNALADNIAQFHSRLTATKASTEAIVKALRADINAAAASDTPAPAQPDMSEYKISLKIVPKDRMHTTTNKDTGILGKLIAKTLLRGNALRKVAGRNKYVIQ